jgi:hypothetical protein
MGLGIPVHKSERSLHNPKHHALKFELVSFLYLNVCVLRVHGFEDHASFPAQIFFHLSFAKIPAALNRLTFQASEANASRP